MHKSYLSPFKFHLHHWNIEIVEYYVFKTFFHIIYSLLNLFLPIYFLHDLGYSLWIVILYFFITQLFFVITVPFVGKIVEKLGLKHSMLAHLPFLIVFFYGITLLSGDISKDIWLLIVIIFLRSASKSIYGLANTIFMSKYLAKKSLGKMLAWLKIAMTLATIITPVLGGIVSYYLGFNALFIIAIILVILSSIPLLLTPDKHFKIKYTPKNIIETIPKIDKNYLLAELGSVARGVVMWTMWPIFLYFILKDTISIGVLLSISALITMVTSYYVGKLVDLGNRKKLLTRGVFISSLLFFLRPIFINPFLIGSLDAIDRITSPLLDISYDYYLLKFIARSKDPIKIANIREFLIEFYYMIGVLLLGIIIWISPNLSHNLFIIIFAIFSVVSLLMKHMSSVDKKNTRA